MKIYTLEDLIALDNDALKKVARQVFSLQFDPFSELGQRAIERRCQQTPGFKRLNRLSPAIGQVIGAVTANLIENILGYQNVLQSA